MFFFFALVEYRIIDLLSLYHYHHLSYRVDELRIVKMFHSTSALFISHNNNNIRCHGPAATLI